LIKNLRSAYLLVANLDRLTELIEVRSPNGLPSEILKDKDLAFILTAAAYLADDDSRFNLAMLASATSRSRLELIQTLKLAEKENLVYEVREFEYFDFYGFTDRTICDELKEAENPKQKETSTLAREYYRNFVNFYFNGDDAEKAIANLESRFEQQLISVPLLILLARRSNISAASQPEYAFQLNWSVARLLSKNGVARFEEALEASRYAIELLKQLDGNNLQRFHLNLLILQFSIMLEKGDYKNQLTESLLNEIKSHRDYLVLDADNLVQFKLLEIRFRFSRYDMNKSDDKIGNQLCDELIQSEQVSTNPVRLQAEFYKIKLIPSYKFDPGAKDNKWSEHDARSAYFKYLSILSDLKDRPELKELHRQVLNDFAGSFLSDKILSRLGTTDKENQVFANATSFLKSIEISGIEELYQLIEQLFSERIGLEGIVTDQSDILSFVNQETLYRNDATSIDKRGLCYTLNFRTRAFVYMGKYVEAVEQGLMAFKFNKLVGDFKGCCVGSGTVANCYMSLREPVKAFEWYEKSFGYGWRIGDPSQADILVKMRSVAEGLAHQDLIPKVEFYQKQFEYRQLISWCDPEKQDAEIFDLLLTGRPKPNAAASYYPFFSDPASIRAELNKVLNILSTINYNAKSLDYSWRANNAATVQVKITVAEADPLKVNIDFPSDIRKQFLFKKSGSDVSWILANAMELKNA